MEKTMIEKIEELTEKIKEEIEELDKEIQLEKSCDDKSKTEEKDTKEKEEEEEEEEAADDKDSDVDDGEAEKKDDSEKDDKEDDDEVEESYEHPWDELIENGVVTEGTKEEYTKFFKEKLKKFGVKSPSQLSKNDKKKFFTEIEKEWTKEKK